VNSAGAFKLNLNKPFCASQQQQLNPETQNPEPLNPETLNPETLNPKP